MHSKRHEWHAVTTPNQCRVKNDTTRQMRAQEYIDAVIEDNPDFSRRDALAGAIDDAREADDTEALETLLSMAEIMERKP